MSKVLKWAEDAKGVLIFMGLVIGPWVLVALLPPSCQVALGFKEPEDIAIDGMKDVIRGNVFENPDSPEAKRFMDCWADYVKRKANYQQKRVYASLYKAHQQGGDESRMNELAIEAEQAGLPELTRKAHETCE